MLKLFFENLTLVKRLGNASVRNELCCKDYKLVGMNIRMGN
jgi:hypothetical protein